jgi:hypothetical protein
VIGPTSRRRDRGCRAGGFARSEVGRSDASRSTSTAASLFRAGGLRSAFVRARARLLLEPPLARAGLGSSARACAGRRAPRAASRRVAPSPARGCEAGCARPGDRSSTAPPGKTTRRFWHVGERASSLDVEHGLDARRRLLGVLTARTARARDADLDLREPAGGRSACTRIDSAPRPEGASAAENWSRVVGRPTGGD